MQTVDFSPFYRSTVGFDRLFNRLDTLVGQEAKSYPPYNIERVGENAYRISIAVAGFANGDIAIETKENSLVIKGAKPADADKTRCAGAISARADLRAKGWAEAELPPLWLSMLPSRSWLSISNKPLPSMIHTPVKNPISQLNPA